MLWWLLFVVLSIFVYVKCIIPHQHWKKRNLPHKKPWPIVGHTGPILFKTKPIQETIVDLYQHFNSRYFGIYQFFQPTILLKDPELIKQIAIKDFDSFLDHREFMSEEIDPLFGKNLFSLRGQRWRNMRSILSPAFTGSKMRSMYALIEETAEQFTDYFLQLAKTKQNHVDVEMKDIFTRFSNDVIATCAFGIKVDSMKDQNNEFYIYGKDASNFGGLRSLKFFGYTISPFLMNLFKVKIFGDEVGNFFRNVVKTTMETREKEGIVRPDMIHLLMQAKKGQLKHEDVKSKDDAGFATVEESQVGKEDVDVAELSDDDLTAQAVLFFIAGFETISSTMCLIAYELAIHPEIQQKLQHEIDEAFQENNNKITYDVIMKLKYLDMVISEGLRKWPVAIMVDRVCNKPYLIEPVGDEEPFQMEVGDVCWLPIYALHRDPEFYSDPERFDPERFNDENKGKINPLTYIPFGVGPRNCIGSRFALLEAKTIFIHLLRKFNLVVTKKTDIPMKFSKSNFNLASANGFHLGLEPRNI